MTQIWQVSELTRYIRQVLELDYRLQDVTVQGEISNLSLPRSGHLYFTIKDEAAVLKGVMWKPQVQSLRSFPQEGDLVLASGRITVYDANGQHQLIANRLQPAGGEGDLARQFEALKQKLQALGLFDSARKRPLPRYPQKIALVTSPTGAAVQDMLNVLRRRWPVAEVFVCLTAVQGSQAPAEIVQALRTANQLQVDVILLARGGGSLEDLAAFNSEVVAYAIAQSQTPVVSGVGHEVDFTIADFVADVRAPTPSAAAELATPSSEDLRQVLDQSGLALANALRQQLERTRWQLEKTQLQLKAQHPSQQIQQQRQALNHQQERLTRAIQQHLTAHRHHLQTAQTKLSALSPLTVLERGYAIVSTTDGQVISQASQAHEQQALQVRLQAGQLGVTVTDIYPLTEPKP
jgi:exodeoxyribonuclease VII large subunit